MTEDIIKTLLPVFSVIVAGIVSHVRLQAQVSDINREIVDVKQKAKDIENDAEKVEEKTVQAMGAMSKSIQDLTIQVARMMERLEHANKKVIDLSRKELEDLFNGKF